MTARRRNRFQTKATESINLIQRDHIEGRGQHMSNIPSYDVDLFTDDALAEPYDHYRAIRDLGPVVHLGAHDMLAVSRYAEVRGVLGDPATYCSGEGVGLNEVVNGLFKGNTLMSDGELHRTQREVVGRPLTPKALADLQPEVQALANELVARVVTQGSFDAVTELAQPIPTTWVPDLLGWPSEARKHLLDWANASFDSLGPLNDRGIAAGGQLAEMFKFAKEIAERGGLPKGSFAANVLDAAVKGEITKEQCPVLLTGYLAPSLDTTISAIGNAVWLFATNPDQWDLLRENPARVKNAFNEAIRLESPISCFSRVATVAAELGGVEVPEGARMLVMYASANRDERRWDRADEFDITREVSSHLGFGHGVHACAGMGLARMEGIAVLSALVARVEKIELGTPVRKLNNLIRAFASLPVRVTAA
jgi:cytochrome P450